MSSNQRRPKRQCVQRKTAVPSAAHYVGYVEDQETPEMIMRKFEELERVLAGEGSNPCVDKADEPPCSNHPMQVEESGAENSNVQRDERGKAQDDDQERIMLEVFKRTSYFNMKAVLQDSHAEARDLHHTEALDDGGWCSASDVYSSDSDGDPASFWSDDDQAGEGRKLKVKGPPRPRIVRVRPHTSARERHMRHQVLTQYNRDTNALIRRRIRPVHKDDIFQLRIPPPPLPLSWGRTVKPYDPAFAYAFSSMAISEQQTNIAAAAAAAAPPPNQTPAGQLAPSAAEAAAGPDTQGQQQQQKQQQQTPAAAGPACSSRPEAAPRALQLPHSSAAVQQPSGTHNAHTITETTERSLLLDTGHPNGSVCHETDDLPRHVLSKAVLRPYQAVLINSGWEPPSSNDDNQGMLMQRFRSLALPKLCPSGFIFVWSCKQHLHPITKQLYAWGYQYIENLTWVWTLPNNCIANESYTYAKRSHLTLLIFRMEGEGKDIELKHQRNPDVVFDCVRSVAGRQWEVPPEVYNIIETMLPTGKGHFLELWAAAGMARQGWTHVVETIRAVM